MLVSGLILTLATLQVSTLGPVLRELHHHLRTVDTFLDALPSPLVTSSLTDSPEILHEPFYQIFLTYFNPSKIPSSQTSLHLIIPYNLPHLLGVRSLWLR